MSLDDTATNVETKSCCRTPTRIPSLRSYNRLSRTFCCWPSQCSERAKACEQFSLSFLGDSWPSIYDSYLNLRDLAIRGTKVRLSFQANSIALGSVPKSVTKKIGEHVHNEFVVCLNCRQVKWKVYFE